MPSILQYDNAIKRAQAAGDEEAAQILSQQLDALMAKEYGYTVQQGSDSGFFEDIASGFGAGAVGMAEICRARYCRTTGRRRRTKSSRED
jgi:hypothetical protein